MAEACDHAVALLQEAPLRELIATRMVSHVVALGQTGGFVLEVHFGERKAQLVNSRGSVRVFSSLPAIATLMKRLGQCRFEVDVSNYVQGRVRPQQPLRSQLMKAGTLPRATAHASENLPKEKAP